MIMAKITAPMLYLSELYFTDGDGSYRFQWTNQAWLDQNTHPGSQVDDNEYYQALAKYNYISEHLNDGSNKAVSYRINIYDRDSQKKIFTNVISDFSINVNLEEGEYLWEIQALDGNGNIITTSEKSYINTQFDDWENDATISYRDSCTSHQVGEVGEERNTGSFPDYHARVAWAGRIISGGNDSNFIVCGPCECGNEAAWEFAQDAGFTYSTANAFGGFEGEFLLCGNVLITCSGLYEYENGQWNYKIFTAPWVDGPETGTAEKAYFFVEGEKTIYEWNSQQDKIVEVLTAAKEIYYVSDYYYVTQDGVFSIKDKSKVVDYDVRYGECPVFDDLFFNIYAENSDGHKVEVLETGEKGSVVVQYYFFDKKNNKVIDKKITLWEGNAPFLIDSEEIYEARVGNCITFVMQDENDDMVSNKAYIYIHEICEDGTVNESSFTCRTWDDVTFTTDDGYLMCEYEDSYKVFNNIKPVFKELSFTVSKMKIGDKNGISFKNIPGSEHIAAYSVDNFASALYIEAESGTLDTFGLPAGNYSLRVSGDDGNSWVDCENIVSSGSNTPQKFTSDADGNMDVFFANASGRWTPGYAAEHSGEKGIWAGTKELVSLARKNKLADIFAGSDDANILVMTDDANGDALFLDDMYTALGDQARLSRIEEIRAGAGDDIIDMTSQRYAYAGSEMTIRGGAGNDVIWATGEDNNLFGDAGNDRIIGSSGFDLIVGGAGDDIMHTGGGGDDIFAFCQNWGNDTVQLTDNDEYIVLWFAEGNRNNWDAGNRIYKSGSNSVQVIGGKNCYIDLKFGDEGGEYDDMVSAGAFESATSEKIFEDKNSGMLV